MQHCILGAGRGSYQRLMLGPDEQKRCKAGRLGSTGQGRRSAKSQITQPRTKFSLRTEVQL